MKNKEENYKASEAIVLRRFKTDRIEQIEKITLEITGKRLTSEQFDELIENEVAILDIKLAQAQQQYEKFLQEKENTQPLKKDM